MAQRIIRFLKKYASSPGFYRVDGKPVYYFQTYGWSVKPEELEAMFRKVETAAGPVHWMIFGAVTASGRSRSWPGWSTAPAITAAARRPAPGS